MLFSTLFSTYLNYLTDMSFSAVYLFTITSFFFNLQTSSTCSCSPFFTGSRSFFTFLSFCSTFPTLSISQRYNTNPCTTPQGVRTEVATRPSLTRPAGRSDRRWCRRGLCDRSPSLSSVTTAHRSHETGKTSNN